MARTFLTVFILMVLVGVLYALIWKTPTKDPKHDKKQLTRQQSEVLVEREALRGKVDKYIVSKSDNPDDLPYTLIAARENLRTAKTPDHLAYATENLKKEWGYIQDKR